MKGNRSKPVGRVFEKKDSRMYGQKDVLDNFRIADKVGVNFYERYQIYDKTLRCGGLKDSDYQDPSGIEDLDRKISIKDYVPTGKNLKNIIV